jgi:hypothetical protein
MVSKQMHDDINDTPLSELRRNFVAAAAMLFVVGLGALAVVSLLDYW